MKINSGTKLPMPRLYKTSAKLLKSVGEGGSINDLIYKVKFGNIKAMYALVCNAIRNESLLNEIFDKSGLRKEGIDQNVARILVTELLWGKKNVMASNKTIEIVESYLPKLKEAIKESSISETTQKEFKPRYARINSLLTSVEKAIKRLKGLGWCIETTPDSYERFKEKAVDLGENEFLMDYHFDDLLVFSPKAQLHSNEMVNDGHLLLHDKASCLAPLLLNPAPGSTVLDMCAAPGMKTMHLASLMNNEGCLYSVDVHKWRFRLLQNTIEKSCPEENCVRPLLQDSISLSADDCPEVKYILVDPSCSGGGMSKRIEDKDSNSNIAPERLRKLTGFQAKILTHALTAFPDVERVVYSTCSELVEENEQIISDVLAKVPEFQVASPSVEWTRRGNPQYEFGSNCLVASRKGDLTNGFFVAVLERVCKNVPDKHLDTIPQTKLTKKKRKSNVLETSGSSEIVKDMESKTKNIPKKERKSNVLETSGSSEIVEDVESKTKNIPKKKRKSNVLEISGSSEIVKDVESKTKNVPKKKRKSKTT